MPAKEITEVQTGGPLALLAALSLLGFACSRCSEARRPGSSEMSSKPPVARRVDHVETRHGRQVIDPYHWLRDDNRERPEVLAHLEAENVYTRAVMRPTEGLQQELFDEMVGRIQQTDQSAPVRRGEYFYYHRTVEGLQYKIHCRKRGSLDAVEEVLLDENELAAGHEYLRVGALRISPDHNLLAFSTDFDGGEKYTLQFKDLRSGELLPDRIPGTYYSVEWANDNRTVYYNTVDAAHRPYRLWRHVLGGDPADDALVYEEPDEAFFLELYKTKDRRYVMVQLESAVTSEVRWLDAARPEAPMRIVQPRRHTVEYWVEHRDGVFYILTNDGAINFKLVQAPVETPGRDHWQTLIAHDERVKLEALDVFATHLVVADRRDGLRGIRVMRWADRQEHRIDFPEPVYTAFATDNPEFDARILRFTYESLVTPESVYDYDMEMRTRELKKRQEVLGGYDPAAYRTERLLAVAADGTQVPISLVYRKGLVRDGSSPLLLYGYGAYGYTIEPSFSSPRVSLLDRGVAFAIAHVRGGGALGRPWYEDGKLLHKRNTFSDFIAAAEHLVAEKYTSPQRLAILGGSAGGLLVGAVVNLRPELFRAAVAKVPFVDVMSTMLDPTIPLTVIEWEEWGDPRDPHYYEYMASYSPYDNVVAQDYPDLLVTAGLNDPRVAYWEPAKWVAKLRATNSGDGVVLLKTNLDAGHSGASGRYDSLKETAFEYAFVLERLGVAP